MISGKKDILEELSLYTFAIYIVTLYLFVRRAETLFLSEIAFILFAGCAMLFLIKNKQIYIHPYFWFLGAFFLYSLISYLWSVNPNDTFSKSITIFQIFILCILIYHVFSYSNRIDFFINSMLVAGLLLCIYAIYIYTPSGFINALFTGYRLGGDISQENEMGMQAATTVVLCFYVALFKKKTVFFIVSIAPFLLAMSSGSKKSLIIIFLGILMLLYVKIGSKNIFRLILIILMLSIALYIIIKLPIFNMIYLRYEKFFISMFNEGATYSTNTSTYIRKQMIEYGLEWFYKRPILGYGSNGASTLYLNATGIKTYLHNNFIELLVNGGIVGFTLFYSMYTYIIYKLIPLIKTKNLEAIIIATILIIRIITDMASVSYSSKLVYVYLSIGFLMAIKASDTNKKEGKNEEG